MNHPTEEKETEIQDDDKFIHVINYIRKHNSCIISKKNGIYELLCNICFQKCKIIPRVTSKCHYSEFHELILNNKWIAFSGFKSIFGDRIYFKCTICCEFNNIYSGNGVNKFCKHVLLKIDPYTKAKRYKLFKFT